MFALWKGLAAKRLAHGMFERAKVAAVHDFNIGDFGGSLGITIEGAIRPEFLSNLNFIPTTGTQPALESRQALFSRRLNKDHCDVATCP
jgi:hypothetical protein